MAKGTKYRFKRLKYQVLTILDEEKKEFGRLRIEPGELGWQPAGGQWHRLSIEQFGDLAVKHGVQAEAELK